MGNKSGNVTSTDFHQKDWQVTDRQASQNQSKGNYRVLQNLRTGDLIDEYQMFWPTQQDFLFYLDSYNWRKQQYNIVQSRYIVQQHKQQFCSKSFVAKIYIQHIPTRLSDVTDIPYPDNLYVALSTLQGYQKLYENIHHYFPITEDQVCIDKQGFVKVWVNSDLSKNYPETDLYVNADHKDQSHMVEQLLTLIWQNTDEQSEPVAFRQFFQKKKNKKRIGFDEAKVIVNEYAKNVSCQIPQKFVSILQMREESGEYQDTRNDHPEQNRFPHEEHLGNYEQHGLDNQDQEEHKVLYGNYGNQYHGQLIENHMPNQSSSTFYPSHHFHQPQAYNQISSYQTPQYHQMPVAHAISQPFLPKPISAQNGPLISIPPVRTHINVPYGYHHTANPIIHQNQPIVIQRQQNIRNIVNSNNQAFYSTQGLNNKNQQFEQRVSTLNQNNGDYTSSEQRYSQQHTYNGQTQGYDQYTQGDNFTRQNQTKYIENNNSPVNRSLQLINKSSKKVSQTQKLRVNKSHINQATGQAITINYPNKQIQQRSYNSRHTPNESSRHRQNEEIIQYEQDQSSNIILDTKYYTLDTQVQLDEQIAADLKRFIMAS